MDQFSLWLILGTKQISFAFLIWKKWLLHDSFIVQKTWKTYLNGSSAYQLARKIEILKKEIKSWKKQCYNKLLIKSNQISVGNCSNQVMNKPVDYSAWSQVKCLKNQLEQSLMEKEIHGVHRTQQTWLQLGNRNNKYFQTILPLEASKCGLENTGWTR